MIIDSTKNKRDQNNRPYVLISTAISLDGCIDDDSNQRLILSNQSDWKAVDELRASCDAILVGAGTLRKDNPHLRIHSQELINERIQNGKTPQPLRVSLTSKGNLISNLHFFEDDKAGNILYCRDFSPDETKFNAEIRKIPTDASISWILNDLFNLGVKNLLIEGGASINTAFLKAGLVDELRLAFAPILVGLQNAPHLISNPISNCHEYTRLKLQSVQQLGDMVIAHYLK